MSFDLGPDVIIKGSQETINMLVSLLERDADSPKNMKMLMIPEEYMLYGQIIIEQGNLVHFVQHRRWEDVPPEEITIQTAPADDGGGWIAWTEGMWNEGLKREGDSEEEALAQLHADLSDHLKDMDRRCVPLPRGLARIHITEHKRPSFLGIVK